MGWQFTRGVLGAALAFCSALHADVSGTPREIQDFTDLLKHYQQYPEYISILESADKARLEQYKKYDAGTLKALPAAAFKNLYQRFYPAYIGFKESKAKFQKNIKSLEDKKIALPLSDKKDIVEIDLRMQAAGDQLTQAKFVLFDLSLKANKALMEMYKSPSVAKAMSDAATATTAADGKPNATPDGKASKFPKMPGTPQGSKADRMSATDAEKLNLTPVDAEFYKTQLGKKLEKDLGGKADYWSYDYEQDDLYVVAGGTVSKLRVKQKDQATRIIQTRVGSGFQDFPSNYAGDEKVDLNAARGRFLTGSQADATLFGPMPTAADNAIPEGPLPARSHPKPVNSDHHP